MKRAIPVLLLLTQVVSPCPAQNVTDIDGNVYPVITIGTRKWMAENLRTTRFSDGSPITNAGYGNWYFLPLNEPRYCEPITLPEWSDTLRLGYWYNYPAVGDARNICPQGWHVATDAEWYAMALYLDPEADTSSAFTLESATAGGMLKDTALWLAPNVGATNSTGFSALPVSDISGFIAWPAGHVCCQSMNAAFWCGGPEWYPGLTCRYRFLDYMQANMTRNNDDYANGKSVRCVCDTLGIASLEEHDSSDGVILFPNPATNFLTVFQPMEKFGSYAIYNALGVWVLGGYTADDRVRLDVSFLPDGLYVVQLSDGMKTIKWIKRTD